MKISVNKNGQRKEYVVIDHNCKRESCFIPHTSNGMNICRMFDYGQCYKISNNTGPRRETYIPERIRYGY
jgi:hypothetical protein